MCHTVLVTKSKAMQNEHLQGRQSKIHLQHGIRRVHCANKKVTEKNNLASENNLEMGIRW